jgi:peroxiredoxin
MAFAGRLQQAPVDQGGIMLKEGDKAPAVTGASYDGQTFDIGAPARRTVLYFYPEANTSG